MGGGLKDTPAPTQNIERGPPNPHLLHKPLLGDGILGHIDPFVSSLSSIDPLLNNSQKMIDNLSPNDHYYLAKFSSKFSNFPKSLSKMCPILFAFTVWLFEILASTYAGPLWSWTIYNLKKCYKLNMFQDNLKAYCSSSIYKHTPMLDLRYSKPGIPAAL